MLCRYSTACLVAGLLLGSADGVRGDLEDPVEAGRRALARDEGHPWYDAEADDIHPLEPRQRARMGSGFSGLAIVAWIAIGATIVLIVVLLLRASLWDRSPLATEGKKASHAPTPVDLEALPVPIKAADSDLLAEARRLYERGEYGQAMVYLYSHLLLRLDRGQLIRLAKGTTNRQYLRELSSRASLGEIFATAMAAFEEAFFGRRQLDRARFEAAWSRLDEFHRLVDGTGSERGAV